MSEKVLVPEEGGGAITRAGGAPSPGDGMPIVPGGISSSPTDASSKLRPFSSSGAFFDFALAAFRLECLLPPFLEAHPNMNFLIFLAVDMEETLASSSSPSPI